MLHHNRGGANDRRQAIRERLAIHEELVHLTIEVSAD